MTPDVDTDRTRLSILLPVRSEGPNLRIMLKLLPAALDVEHEVLVVYDHPGDDSIAVVEALRARYPNVRAIHNGLGPGIPNALRAGVAQARGDFVLIFAADEVGPILAIEDMLDLMARGCDFVSCTRYAHSGRRLGGSIIGGLLSRLANKLFNTIAGSVFTDATTGIKMFRREVFDRLDLVSRPVGWVIVFEMAIKAELLGLRLGEVPIISVDRLYGGTSTFRLGPWFMEYLRWSLWGAGQIRRSKTRRVEPLRPTAPTLRAENTQA
jgi:dolichol-phosphate mannosyltransferase